jgi:hypothetical protein
VEERVVLAAEGRGERLTCRLAPALGPGARRRKGIGPLARAGVDARRGLDHAPDQAIDPAHPRRPAGAAAAARDAPAQALDQRLGDEPGGELEPGKDRRHLLEMNLELTRLAEGAAQAAHGAARPRGRLGLEQRFPHGERFGEAAGGDPDVVDRLLVRAGPHAVGGLDHGGEAGIEVLADALADGGSGRHGAHAPSCSPASSWGWRASRRRTLSARVSATSSTWRVASMVSKPYSPARRSSCPMTRLW